MDTIFALSSGALPSGVAVVRVSGPRAAEVLSVFGAKPTNEREARLVSLYDPDDGQLLDRALVLSFTKPRSFTGEDVIELHLHGSRAIVGCVLSVLGSQEGFRAAEAGEFTRQAFENGKMDLTAVEGLGDLLAAETEQQRRYAIEQSGGELGHKLDALRDQIVDTLAVLEASLEFADEDDVPEDGLSVIEARLSLIRANVELLIASFATGRIVREGFRVALVGRPNVGKSSLLNAMAGSDVAIVTEEAGTTRDLLEVQLDIDGYLVRLIDTAGVRETDSVAEQEGVRRSLAASQSADLVLSLQSTDSEPLDMPDRNTIPIWSKADIHEPPAKMLAISTTSDIGLDSIRKVIGKRLAKLTPASAGAINRTRHLSALEQALADLAGCGKPNLEHDIRAEHLRLAARSIGRLTSRVEPEEVLDRVFQGFCIGK